MNNDVKTLEFLKTVTRKEFKEEFDFDISFAAFG